MMKNNLLRLAVVVGLFGTQLDAAVFAQDKLSGDIKIDGSSTVYLITEAMAVNFKKLHPDLKVSVGISGTGGGFKKFAQGETDISDASRPIRKQEADVCRQNGVEYLELQVAWDGLTVVIHPENTWARQMTVEQLRKIWHPDSAVKKWSDVDANWPSEEIKLYGAGPDSGTFDYFTEAINGKEKICRKDYQASEDDNVLVNGVAGNKFALGFFGLAYYEENKTKIKDVAIAAKAGNPYVEPTPTTVLSGAYKPLSRPLFIYVKKSALQRPEIRAFVEFYLRRADLVATSKYVKMNARQQAAQRTKFQQATKNLN